MDIDITILKSDILPEVYTITGYNGKAAKDIDAISTTDDDKSILSIYMDEALTDLSEIVSRSGFLKTDDDTSFVFSFTLPDNWNTNTQTSLSKNISQYVVNYICYKWFMFTKQDVSKSYIDTITNIVLKIRKNLTERNKP